MVDILLIRHGETEWNRLGRFRGRAAVALNEKGLWDVDATAQRIAREWDVAAVYSSPVRRALQTAEVIAAATGQMVQLADELADVDYGQWEGLTEDEAAARDPDVLRRFREAPGDVRIPGGETLREAQSRSFRALRALASSYDEQTIALVAHTDINRLIILAALGASAHAIGRVGQGTCAINVLTVGNGRIEVVRINDQCHLKARRAEPA